MRNILKLYKNTGILFVLLLMGNVHLQAQSSNNIIEPTKNQLKVYNKAKVYLSKSKPDIALPILYSLLDSITPKTDFSIKIDISIAEGYRMKKETEKGTELLKSLLLTENLSDENKAHIYNRLAALIGYYSKEDLRTTVSYSNKCIKLAKKIGDDELIASSRNELGYVYMRVGKANIAEAYYRKAFAYFIKTKKNVYAANVAINLSNNYLKQKQYKPAFQIIDSVMKTMDEKHYRNMFMRLYLQKASVYENWNKIDSAYKYLSRSRIAQKHFFLDRMDEQVFDMNAKYDLQLKENEIIQEKLLKEKQRKENYFLIIIVVVLLTVVIITFIILYLKRLANIQNNKIDKYEKKLLRNKIENKNKELSTAIAYAYSYNNSLQLIKKTLVTKSTNEAVNAINVAINTDYNWIKFITTFNELKPNFFHNLENTHSNITETEKKLAALLSMKLTSKEISGVLSVELSSVNKSRQRLRKKLKIDSNIDLKDYFNKF